METEKDRLKQRLSGYIEDLQSQKETFVKGVQTYKQAFSEKYQLSLETLQKAKTGLVILGGLYVTFKLVNWILGGSEYNEERTGTGPQIVVVGAPELSIVAKIRNSIVMLLLGIAQKELEKVIKKWMSDMDAKGEKHEKHDNHQEHA